MKLSSICAIAAAFLVAGCATNQKFSAKMDSFVGLREVALVTALGPPVNVYATADGDRVLSFRRASSMPVGGGTYTQPVTTASQGVIYGPGGATTYNGTSTSYQQVQQPTYSINLWCEVNFTVASIGIVKDWRASGNHCVSN